MFDLANRFSLSSTKFSKGIAACLVILWLVTVATAISSILSQPFSKKQRVFWILMVVCLPVVGLILYLPFSVKHDEYPLLFNWKHKK